MRSVGDLPMIENDLEFRYWRAWERSPKDVPIVISPPPTLSVRTKLLHGFPSLKLGRLPNVTPGLNPDPLLQQ